MNEQEELILNVLLSVQVIKGKTKFVKILYLVCKLLEANNMKAPFEFRPDQYGIYAPGLEPVLENLQNENYIQISKSRFSKREDLSVVNLPSGYDSGVSVMGPRIETLVKALNQHTSDEIVAISYHLFPDTTINSRIKPEVNKKIIELFSALSSRFEDSDDKEEVFEKPVSEVRKLYPQFNDMDARLNLIKSMGLKELPPIIPSVIDASTGILAKKHPFFKNYNLEEMLEDARRR